MAAGIIAQKLGKPFVVTARGTDLNLRTATAASALSGVCYALMDSLQTLGSDPAKLHTLRNGVDPVRFAPKPRDPARKRLGLSPDAKLLLSVGHLIERKGHHVAIAALPLLTKEVRLPIVGSGPEKAALQKQTEALGVVSKPDARVLIPDRTGQCLAQVWGELLANNQSSQVLA